MSSSKRPISRNTMKWPQLSEDYTPRDDPWEPIVLSLDGGGIRGLSSLYILKQLMTKIAEAETAAQNNELSNRSTQNVSPRLPCHYFDFIVGTSTGGLIAVMLGRLRMTVDECIQEYLEFGSHVFANRRWGRITKYDHRKLKKSIQDVIATHCEDLHEDDDPCVGEDYLRQWDFSQYEGPFKNYTCKVALVAQRERGGKTHVPDETYLFRTYDHPAPEPQAYIIDHTNELNPGSVFNDETKIWEACRATSAAPLYFNKKRIMNVRYMDGGVGANNPAMLAATEALQMDKARRKGKENLSLLISVGTGQPKAQSRFGTGLIPLFKYMRKLITASKPAHDSAAGLLHGRGAPYYRFDVPSPGLSKIKLDECKMIKKKKNKDKETVHQNGLILNGAPKVPPSETPPTIDLQAVVLPAEGNAMELGNSSTDPNNSSEETSAQSPPTRKNESTPRKFHYKPDDYTYKTFEKIECETNKYCTREGSVTSEGIKQRLTEAANVLVYYRRRREYDTPEQWKKFIGNASQSSRRSETV